MSPERHVWTVLFYTHENLQKTHMGRKTQTGRRIVRNNKICVPSDKEMNRDIGGNNRIGSPRYFYDSEIRRDGKH